MITDQSVGRTVALVESVAGEFFEQIENCICFFFRNFVRTGTAFDEILSFFGHLFLVFLAHGPPEKIALCERITGEFARGRHDLLLVNHNAVRIGANFLEQRMFVADLHQASFALDVIADQIHRPWSIKRDQCNDIVDLAHIELFCRAGHTAGFHLEKADCFAVVVERK